MRVGSWLAVGLSLAACAPMPPVVPRLASADAAPAAERVGRLRAERQRSTGIRTMRAEPALARAAGRGVDVAVIDTGIDPGHREFSGRLHPASRDMVGDSLLGPSPHGTHVAGIIAAARDGRGMSGIAPRARVLALRADARDAGCRRGGCYFRDDDLARAVDAATAAGVEVINLSLTKTSRLSTDLTAALRRAARSGALLVVAAGNGDSAKASWPARLATDKAFANRMLVVGAVDSRDRSWIDTNRPGRTGLAEHFVVALGVDVLSTVPGGYGRASGTSMAAAEVSGAAALLKSLFPHLSMARIGRLLRESARNLGAPGADPVFGAGSVDLTAAMAPRGGLRAGSAVDLTSSAFRAGSAFGDGPSAALRRNVVASDVLERSYRLDLGDAVAMPVTADPVAAWLQPPPLSWQGGDLAGTSLAAGFDQAGRAEGYRAEGGAGRLGWTVSRGVGLLSDDPVADLMGTATTVGIDLPTSEQVGIRLLAASEAGRQLQRFAVEAQSAAFAGSLTLDRLEEADGPLGSGGDGALAPGGATSHFLGATVGWRPWPRLGIGLSGTLGSTETAGGPALDQWGRLVSSAWSLGFDLLDALTDGDSLGLRLTQPLRVEQGSARLRLDTDDSVDLSPSGREIDLELAWRRSLARSSTLAVFLLLSDQQRHDSAAGVGGGFGLRLDRRF